MARFQRIRNLYDLATNPKRYQNDRDVDLEETANPDEWRDSTKPTIRERLASRKRLFLAFGFLGFIVVGLLGVYSSRYLPGLYQNQLLKEAIKWAIVVPFTFVAGTRFIRSRLEDVDWLVLLIPYQGLGFYVGSLDEDSAGNTTFDPVKGFDIIGLRGASMTLGDLGDDFARNFAKQGRKPDDQATIRVEDALYVSRDTFIGNVTAVLTDGIELDEFGRESDIYTAPPGLADQETYVELRETVEEVVRENLRLKKRNEALQEERDDWKDEALKKRKEIREELVDTHGDLAESGFAPRSGRRRGSTSSKADGNGAHEAEQ